MALSAGSPTAESVFALRTLAHRPAWMDVENKALSDIMLRIPAKNFVLYTMGAKASQPVWFPLVRLRGLECLTP